jgi:hypothetical protein
MRYTGAESCRGRLIQIERETLLPLKNVDPTAPFPSRGKECVVRRKPEVAGVQEAPGRPKGLDRFVADL